MQLERRFDGETWRWCVITGKGEVLAEFNSRDDAAAWVQQHARTPHEKAKLHAARMRAERG